MSTEEDEERAAQEAYASAWRLGGADALYDLMVQLGRWARPCPACRGAKARNISKRGDPVLLRACEVCRHHGKIALSTAKLAVVQRTAEPILSPDGQFEWDHEERAWVARPASIFSGLAELVAKRRSGR